MSNQRMAYQNPLFQAVNQGVYQMLPNFAKTGTSMSGSLSNQVPAAPAAANQAGGFDMGHLLQILAGVGGGVGLAGLITGTNPYGSIVNGIKRAVGGTPSPTPFTGPTDPNEFTGPVDPNGGWEPPSTWGVGNPDDLPGRVTGGPY
jgi:hypothetical protein